LRAASTLFGKKLVTTSTPRLSGTSPSVVAVGISPTVTLSGAALGDGVGDQVLLNGVPLSVPPSSWSDTSIQFPWASAQSDGKKFTAGQQVSVGLIVNGQACSSLPVPLQGPSMGGIVKTPQHHQAHQDTPLPRTQAVPLFLLRCWSDALMTRFRKAWLLYDPPHYCFILDTDENKFFTQDYLGESNLPLASDHRHSSDAFGCGRRFAWSDPFARKAVPAIFFLSGFW